MSIIHTAVRNEVNAFDYLNALQDNIESVTADPECWLPWNYEGTLAHELAKAA